MDSLVAVVDIPAVAVDYKVAVVDKALEAVADSVGAAVAEALILVVALHVAEIPINKI